MESNISCVQISERLCNSVFSYYRFFSNEQVPAPLQDETKMVWQEAGAKRVRESKGSREKPLEKLQNSWRRLRTYTAVRTWADEAAGLAFKPIEARSLKSWGAPADICFRYFQLIKTEECQNQERGKNQQCVYRRANVFVCSGLMWYPWLCIHH